MIATSRITDAKTHFMSSGEAGTDDVSEGYGGYFSPGVAGSPGREALRYQVQVALLEFGFTGNLKAAYTDVLKAELEGKAALTRARNVASTMRSLINTAGLVRENPGLLELRVLTAGQRPRVHFTVGAPQSVEGADSGANP